MNEGPWADNLRGTIMIIINYVKKLVEVVYMGPNLQSSRGIITEVNN